MRLSALPLCVVVWSVGSLTASHAAESGPAASASQPLVMVVMDPLAKPLSCPCVEGYAQRDYDKLGEALSQALARPVEVVYSESLSVALKKYTSGKAHLVIGKQSVVQYDSEQSKLASTPVAALTGKDGSTTQSGLIVVPAGDPAKTPADLAGYRILFGPEESAEKHAEALALLKKHGVASPKKLETVQGCSDGCTIILELPEGKNGAAVISSYAKPLLEGCGTVQKGDLRVVGETAAIPFIQAFVTDQLTSEQQESVVAALVASTVDPTLREALETRDGFVPVDVAQQLSTVDASEAAAVAKKK